MSNQPHRSSPSRPASLWLLFTVGLWALACGDQGKPPGGCAEGLTACNGSCVDLATNPTSCGVCGASCSLGQACSAGSCSCLPGLSACAGACVDVQSSGENCGSCGTACTAGAVCNRGSCSDSCDASLLACGSSCVDPLVDVAHCGDCNQPCGAGQTCQGGTCTCSGNLSNCSGSCVDTQNDAAHCGGCGVSCDVGQSCSNGSCQDNGGGTGGAGTGGAATGGGSNTGGTGTGGAATGGASTGGSATGGAGNPDACDPGTTTTEWATSCSNTPATCTAGTWTARPTGSDGHPLRAESEHFALYWHTSDPDGSGPLLGLASPPSAATQQSALNKLESIWDSYFGAPILFPEPYCNSSTKTKAAIHLDDYYPLWGGAWGSGYMGMWVGIGALADDWGLSHEFMHGVQTTTQGFPDCGGNGCWIYESHANWMPHQIQRSNVHCSEMLANAPHLYYGSTRDRYCNWQFFEFVKDKHCYSAVNQMWAYQAPNGQRDPWQKLMLSQGWSIEKLNDLFGEWAMHNVTWDYKNPPNAGGNDQGAVYRSNYGLITDDPGTRTARRLRRTRLEALGNDWANNRQFVSPYYWAPQRWGYNVVRLYPEAGQSEVTVHFRGVTQAAANSGWRWGLVATNAAMTSARYSEMQSGTDGDLTFCLGAGEQLFLVVTATPTQYQKITWGSPGDGTPYASIYRYPYMISLENAWPEGFVGGQLDACPAGTVRHSNGNGCAPSGTPSSVYVGPYARVLGGTVSGSARIEDQATVVNGTVSGGTVGALSLVGVASHPGHGAASFGVSGSAVLQSTFYPLGWFGNNQSISGTARYLGDLEVYSANKSANTFFGLVDDGWSGVSSVSEVTVAPPYAWRN